MQSCSAFISIFNHRMLTHVYRVALDGSQVICHMPPAKTYCAEGNYENITKSISNHKSLDQDNTALLAVSNPMAPYWNPF